MIECIGTEHMQYFMNLLDPSTWYYIQATKTFVITLNSQEVVSWMYQPSKELWCFFRGKVV